MTLRDLRCYLALILATAFLCSCGSATLGTVPQSGLQPAAPPAARSWMAPDAKKSALLYVSDLGTDQVYVYSYPQGKLRGTLSGFDGVHSGCVDAHGNVFITSNEKIFEFAHGGKKPIATLDDSGYGPTGCSVDPKTGNLAVANSGPIYGSDPGNIAIYKRAKGSPQEYTDQNIFIYSDCAYDKTGNLYVVGGDFHGFFKFAEIPAKSASYTDLSLNQYVAVYGGVQWDGKYVAVEDQGAGYHGSTIYQVAVSGSTATAVGTTELGGSSDVIQFWLYGKRIIGPNIGSAPNVMYWKYPAGGAATQTITGFTEPVGVTVSPP